MITSLTYGVQRHHGNDVWHLVGMVTDTYEGAAYWRDFILTNDASLAEWDIRIVSFATTVVHQVTRPANSDI